MKQIVVIGLLVFLVGCEGAAVISGRIVDEYGDPHRNCRLKLIAHEGSPDLANVPVSGEFEEMVLVAPYKAEYLVRVECDGGAEPYERTLRIGPTEYSEKKLDLGVIVIQGAE